MGTKLRKMRGLWVFAVAHLLGAMAAGCSNESRCEDGAGAPSETCNARVSPDEQSCAGACEGDDVGGATCPASCSSNCGALEPSSCEPQGACVPQCGSRQCGLDPVCNQPCGTCDAQSICSEDGLCEKICDLPALTQDTVLDLSVRTVSVKGTVTLNGAPVPDVAWSTHRASLQFIHKQSSAVLEVAMGAEGGFNYDVSLYPGTYEVVLVPESASEQNVLPAYPHQLVAEFDVQHSGTRNFDVKTVEVEATLTLNGAPLPGNGHSGSAPRGRLRFAQGPGSITAPIGPIGPATVSVTLFAGPHTVSFEPESSNNQRIVPPYRQLLSSKEDFSVDGAVTFDVKTVTLSGKLTLDGTALPNYGGEGLGQLEFFDTRSSSSFKTTIGSTGSGAYSVTLYAGSYDVILVPASNQSLLPRLQHRLEENLSLTANATRNFDARTVTLTGTVTLNGAPLPPAGASRGSLSFKSVVGGEPVTVSLGAQGPSSYRVQLFAGTYDVRVSPNGASSWMLPQAEHQVLSRAEFTKSITQDLDLKTVDITGELSLNGAPLRDSAGSRGELRFIDRKTWSSVPASLGAGGPARFSVTLYAGRYDVELHPGDQGMFPAYSHRVLENADFTASTQRAIDVRVIKVSGAVTLNGERLPDNGWSNAERGALRFSSRSSGNSVTTSLGRSGEGRYELRLFEGVYDVMLEPESAEDQNVWPAYRHPLRTGCVERGSCTAPKGDVSGTWRLSMDSSRWGTWWLELSQSGSRVSGSYSYHQASGPLLRGVVESGTLDVTGRPWACTVNLQGTLLDGCTWAGTLTPTGACGGWPKTRFIGQR